MFGNNAQETGQPSSVWRYYLISQRPESQDSAFLWSNFISANNNELLANLGNFVNRVGLGRTLCVMPRGMYCLRSSRLSSS